MQFPLTYFLNLLKLKAGKMDQGLAARRRFKENSPFTKDQATFTILICAQIQSTGILWEEFHPKQPLNLLHALNLSTF